MIKFACPGCAAVFSVGDEKAGKSGKCPKCESQFMIPEAEPPAVGAAPPPLSPPPPAEDPGVEIKPCPGCQAKLTVSPGDLGLDVECPYCKTVYKAKKLGGTAAAPAVDDRPSPRPRDDRPKRRNRGDDDDEDRPSKRRDRYDDDDDDRPSRRRRRVEGRSSSESTTLGIVSLVTGILAIIPGCCCGLFAIPLSLTAIMTGILGLKTKAKGMAMRALSSVQLA